MRPFALTAFLGMFACEASRTVVVEGCPSAELLLDGVTCSPTCTAPSEDAVIEIRNTDECRFVEWAGSCAAIPACRAKDTGGIARFQRIAWPVTLDLSEAAGFEAQLSSSDAGCFSTCQRFVPIDRQFSVRALAPAGTAPVWTGDCDTLVGDSCVAIANRARTMQLRGTPDLVSLMLIADGDGVLRVDGSNETCGPQASCAVSVIRGTSVRVVALPTAGQVFIGWSRSECSGVECTVQVNAGMDLVGSFARARTLRLTSRGPTGGVILNGATEPLPLVRVFAEGTEIQLSAAPGIDDVLFRIEGLPCREPRLIDQCAFRLDDHATGTLAFTRFHQWAVGGWSATPCGLEEDDGGLTLMLNNSADVKLPPSTNADVLARLDADGGLSVLNKGHMTGGAPLSFVGPDGRRWVTSVINDFGMPNRSYAQWGAWDAGIPVRPMESSEMLFVRLDSQFEVDSVVVPPLAPRDDVFTLASARGPLVPSGAGTVFAAVGWGLADGGGSSEGRLVLNAAMDVVRYWAEPQANESDLARVGNDVILISSIFGAQRTIESCTIVNSGQGTTVVAKLDSSGACREASLGSSDLDGGHLYFTGRSLVRGSPDTIGWFEEFSAFAPKARYVAVDAALVPRWEHELKLAPAAGIRIQALHTPTGVTSFSRLFHAQPVVLTSGSISVSCAGPNSLVVMRHRLSDGAADWATCLNASEGAAERIANGGVCPFTQPIRAFGGIALLNTIQASPATEVHFGSSVVPAPNGLSASVLLLTPPTEP